MHASPPILACRALRLGLENGRNLAVWVLTRSGTPSTQGMTHAPQRPNQAGVIHTLACVKHAGFPSRLQPGGSRAGRATRLGPSGVGGAAAAAAPPPPPPGVWGVPRLGVRASQGVRNLCCVAAARSRAFLYHNSKPAACAIRSCLILLQATSDQTTEPWS